MKQEKGITLVALVITVLVMSILAGTAISSGRSIIDSNKVMAFIQELKVVQSEVNVIVEKQKQGDTSYDAIGIEVSRLDTETMTKLVKGPLQGKTAEEIIDFKYYRVSDLQQMGIENVNQSVLINLKTREVISVNGIEDAGKMCYKLEDFPSESYNVQEIATIESTLKEGDYVWYEDANGTKQKCIVLYGPENAKYSSYGIQIITADTVEDVSLGEDVPSTDYNDDAFNKCKDTYNSVIATLNQEAEKYRKKNDGIAEEARCVGSVPNNPSFDGAGIYNSSSIEGVNNMFKSADNNYVEDWNQMNNLVIYNIGKQYFLASRFVNDLGSYNGFAVRCVDVNHQLHYRYLCDIFSGDVATTLYKVSAGLRPVLLLKSGVKITSGDGSEENPYTLAP